MRLFALLSLMLLILTSGAAMSHAAPANIGVVDMQRILEESKAGKSIQSQLKTQREKLNSDITEMEKKIREQEQTLIKQSKELPAADFETKKKEFESTFIKAREEAKKKRIAADSAMKMAIETLQKEIGQVVADISDEKKLDIVMSRNNVVIVAKSLDITQDVLTKLDEKIQSVAVKN